MRIPRSPWGTLGAVILGAAIGAATTRVVTSRRQARVLSTPTTVPPRSLELDERFPHGDLTLAVAAIVDDRGLVNYDLLDADPSPLYEFVAWIEAYSPLNTPEHFPTEADRLAYWLNAYNALVLLTVQDVYPVRSILQAPPVRKAFSSLQFTVGGRLMTLNGMANGIIRPTFRDARVHFALCNATLGSPALRGEAYLPDLLEEQLESQMQAFMHDSSKVKVDFANRALVISPLFKWYEPDFLDRVRRHYPDQPVEIATFLRPYLPLAAQELLAEGGYLLDHLPYDWRLNRSPKSRQTFEEGMVA